MIALYISVTPGGFNSDGDGTDDDDEVEIFRRRRDAGGLGAGKPFGNRVGSDGTSTLQVTS